jgi:hypothetical protein
VRKSLIHRQWNIEVLLIWAHFLLRKKPGFPGVPPQRMAYGPALRPLRAPSIPCAVAVSAPGGHRLYPARKFYTSMAKSLARLVPGTFPLGRGLTISSGPRYCREHRAEPVSKHAGSGTALYKFEWPKPLLKYRTPLFFSKAASFFPVSSAERLFLCLSCGLTGHRRTFSDTSPSSPRPICSCVNQGKLI